VGRDVSRSTLFPLRCIVPDIRSALETIAKLSILKVGDFRGKGQRFPDELTPNMHALTQYFQTMDSNSRPSITSQIKPNSSFVFLWYAKEKSEAVRENDPKLIFEGLVALALENGTFDVRESIIIMPLLSNSSPKLGTDSMDLFRRAANLAQSKALAEELVRFPARREESKSIRAFNFSESGSGKEFTYIGRS